MAFDVIYKKLEKDLNDKKREMAQIIEVSNKAYEARDAAVNEMARLKNQADREHQAFEAEWRDLGKLIDMDRKRRDTNKQKRAGQSSAYKEHRENSLEEEAKLRKKVALMALRHHAVLAATARRLLDQLQVRRRGAKWARGETEGVGGARSEPEGEGWG